MALTTLKCPHCDGEVQFEEEKESGFCVHCGTKIFNDRGRGSQTSSGNDPEIVKKLNDAKEALAAHDWASATRIIDDVLMADTGCLDALYMKVLLGFKDAEARVGLVEEAEKKGQKDYGVFSKDDIRKCWGEHDLRIAYKGLFQQAVIILDDKEAFYIKNGRAVTLGAGPGEHVLALRVVSHGTHVGGELDRLIFTVTKDHDFRIGAGGKLKLKLKIIKMS